MKKLKLLLCIIMIICLIPSSSFGQIAIETMQEDVQVQSLTDQCAISGYEIFCSKKQDSGYGKKPIFTTTNQAYNNTYIKWNKTVYYKVRAFVQVDGKKYYSNWSNVTLAQTDSSITNQMESITKYKKLDKQVSGPLEEMKMQLKSVTIAASAEPVIQKNGRPAITVQWTVDIPKNNSQQEETEDVVADKVVSKPSHKYRVKYYTVTYMNEEGNSYFEGPATVSGQSQTLASDLYSKEGYVQVSWKSETGEEYSFGEEVYLNKNLRLFPIWEAEVNTVIANIDAIGPVELTDICKEKIDKARADFNGLSAENQALVTNVSKLEDAETKYEELKVVATVIANIDAIGPVELTDICKEKIDKARADYDGLSAENQALVTNVSVLKAAEKKYEELGCVAAGTLIMLADGSQKKVEDIKADDILMTYSFYEGQMVGKKLIGYEVNHREDAFIIEIQLEDGKKLSVVDEQAFFDMNDRKYFNIAFENYKDALGKVIMVYENGSYAARTITDIQTSIREETYYELYTEESMNFIADQVVTMYPHDFDNMFSYTADYKVDYVQLQKDIDQYGIYSYDDFKDIMAEEEFLAWNIKYYSIVNGKNGKTSPTSLEELRLILKEAFPIPLEGLNQLRNKTSQAE